MREDDDDDEINYVENILRRAARVAGEVGKELGRTTSYEKGTMFDDQKNEQTGWVNAPEIAIVMFAFLLNFLWEMLQEPFYEGMSAMRHWQAVRLCFKATAGDAVIALIAFSLVSVTARTRRWVLQPTRWQVVGFVAFGVVQTIALEMRATRLGLWHYSDAMPIVPFMDVGWVPLAQWIVLPPLILWLAGRHLR